MIFLRFIAADLRRLWLGSFVVVLLISGATGLGLSINLQERALRLGSARAAERFDLVVGAPGGDTQLVLSSVFLQPSPLTLLSGSIFEKLAADPRVAMAAPVGFGDSFDGMPIVGTTAELVTDGGKAALAEGRNIETIGEAVIGARVQLAMGATIKPMHGLAGEGGHTHAELSYKVVGRMAATNTPWDRAILVPIEAVWRLHHMEARPNYESGPLQPTANVRAALATAKDDDGDHDHDAPDHLGPPWRNAPGVPAIFVKAKTIADAYRLRQEYRTEATLAVFPGEVLARLFATLGDARAVLAAVATATQILVAAAIVLVCVMHLAQRRAQIGALRAFGASRLAVFSLVWIEMLVLLLLGVALGIVFGWGGAKLFTAWLARTSGVVAPVEFTGEDAAWIAILIAAGMVVAAAPAMLAYRGSPAAAMRR
ncbi:FtsX-like permease family protein [Terrarubrum flagellatum]|uniref:FtsX-like permease family protein n=1 Tax=Terrirubrum flagellatum TaxID=2895980 RepID=UPI0031455B00